MPHPTLIFFKAILCLAVAAALFHYAEQAGIVRVTVIADGTIGSRVVDADDETYRHEIDRARTKTMWMYAGSGVFAFIGLYMVRTSLRVARKRRAARKMSAYR